ncbi:aminopeptidase YwaD [Chryseobacterium sp. SORGH_AS 447]|uniref:M28 family metallopeptidase n=1 Tax=Chryseobacterium sp. SORGH_AS_0447 TaxID=3041769 RepID=UPI0027851C5C|nr:M20/M25/M40 family metallo-hydrolase [Chryseobacterium sp. SORGH_AS_0447]MDQ1162198.1 aminopeptidase YwaD [Chryseobacterium sp. SORGH_AS_0447]
MKKLIITALLALCITPSKAQKFVRKYQDRVDQVSKDNIIANLKAFEKLGIKTTGSVENDNALQWIRQQYLSYGYTEDQLMADPFSIGKEKSSNLIITKKGTVYPDRYVIICGHFDSINGPGVNDNGSGTSIILEAARILKDIPTDYSIKFIHFSGEEQGLYGSRHYVNEVAYTRKQRNLDIKMVFNIDEVGGKKGMFNDTVFCDEDQGGNSKNNTASAQVTRELMKCTALYSPLKTEIDPAEDSDYISFEKKGEVITGFFEYLRSDLPHTKDDTFANTDVMYVYNIGKATLGALQHFAGADHH